MIKTIAHLADIHIRKLRRFVEYREVFNRLYKQLEKLNPDLIYVAGDIVHGKLDTSPEETRLVANFFLKLSKFLSVTTYQVMSLSFSGRGLCCVGITCSI